MKWVSLCTDTEVIWWTASISYEIRIWKSIENIFFFAPMESYDRNPLTPNIYFLQNRMRADNLFFPTVFKSIVQNNKAPFLKIYALVSKSPFPILQKSSTSNLEFYAPIKPYTSSPRMPHPQGNILIRITHY